MASCEDDDYVHAKSNDKDGPWTVVSKDTEGVASFVIQKAINDDDVKVVCLNYDFANDRALNQSEDE